MSWSRRLVQLAQNNRLVVVTLFFAIGIGAYFLFRDADPPFGAASPFENPGDTDPAAVDAVYADLIDAVTADSKVLYSRRFVEGRGTDPDANIETWTDQGTYSYRQHGSGAPTRIVVGADRYAPNATRLGYGLGPAPTCHGKFEQAIASLLQCQTSMRDLVVGVVLDSEYKGTPAVAIIATGEVNADGLLYVKEHTYLDKGTMLPLAVVTTRKGWMSQRWTITFEHSFVDRDSLPVDFFDPASIGAEPWDPAKLLETDVGIMVFWLDRAHPGVGDRPDLILDNVNVFPPDDRANRPRAVLYYSGPRDYAAGLLYLEEWQRDEYQRYSGPERGGIPAGGYWWKWPCTTSSEFEVLGGHATAFWRVKLTFEQYNVEEAILAEDGPPPGPCVPGEPDEFRLHIELGETFIVLRPLGRPPDPYASIEALSEVAQLLVPYEP